ncbi:MAG: hypothetical protein C5B43_03350 [Verrucomicrobia bacterium]|nr:MAG: hypothetical protein C5B43_03350 [Verrucomicrobiota bacterium]
MTTTVFAAAVETKAYVLKDICQFEPTEPANNVFENVSVEEFENEVKRVLSSYEIEDLRVLVDEANKVGSGNIWMLEMKIFKFDEAVLTEFKNRELVLEKGRNVFKSLFENPTISGYLARENFQVDIEGDVVFSKIEEDIYFTLANIGFKDNPFYINYRCAKKDSQENRDRQIYDQSTLFYESGSRDIISKKLAANTARIRNKKLQNEPNIFYQLEGDIYEVAAKLKDIENKKNIYKFSHKTDYAYFIMPGGKDSHAYFTTAIVDAKTKKVLAVFLINSFVDEKYSRYLEKRLNDKKSYDKHIPFIDASLMLQTDKDDGNCTLYTANFSHAMIDLISDNRKELDRLAKLSNYDDMADLIKNRLPRYLPQYYKQDHSGAYIKKPAKQIKAHHMRMRWKLSLEDVKDIIARLRSQE